MSAKQFCLKWNNFQNNILHAFESLQSTEDLTDVTLMCEGLHLKAHKFILSACSPYFRTVFKENPCTHPLIILKDVHYVDLIAIVNFMYHGEVLVSEEQLATFLQTAKLLQVSGLNNSDDNNGSSPQQHKRSSSSTTIQSQRKSVMRPCFVRNATTAAESSDYIPAAKKSKNLPSIGTIPHNVKPKASKVISPNNKNSDTSGKVFYSNRGDSSSNSSVLLTHQQQPKDSSAAFEDINNSKSQQHIPLFQSGEEDDEQLTDVNEKVEVVVNEKSMEPVLQQQQQQQQQGSILEAALDGGVVAIIGASQSQQQQQQSKAGSILERSLKSQPIAGKSPSYVPLADQQLALIQQQQQQQSSATTSLALPNLTEVPINTKQPVLLIPRKQQQQPQTTELLTTDSSSISTAVLVIEKRVNISSGISSGTTTTTTTTGSSTSTTSSSAAVAMVPVKTATSSSGSNSPSSQAPYDIQQQQRGGLTPMECLQQTIKIEEDAYDDSNDYTAPDDQNYQSPSSNTRGQHQSSLSSDVQQPHHSSQCGTCPHCGKIYSNQSALKYHVRLVHSDLTNMYCCHLCPEAFDYREGYKKHMVEVHCIRN